MEQASVYKELNFTRLIRDKIGMTAYEQNQPGKNNMNAISPSLYELLTQNFTGDLSLDGVNEEEQVILSVLDNIQRILNSRAGAISHLPDYGLPDMTKILHGMPGTAHELTGTLAAVLLKYEPRLQSLEVTLLEQGIPGELRYALNAELKGVGLVRYGTEFMPEGKVLLRHLKQQQFIDSSAIY